MNALKAKPWAVLALISLALNLFLGGLVVGRMLRPDRSPADTRPISLLRSSRSLDPAARAIVDRAREKHHRDIRGSMARVGAARLAAVEALCAPDFDEAKAREAFAAFRKEVNFSHDKMHESLIDAAKQMTSQQRADLKEALMRDRGWERNRGRFRGPRGAFSGDPLE